MSKTLKSIAIILSFAAFSVGLTFALSHAAEGLRAEQAQEGRAIVQRAIEKHEVKRAAALNMSVEAYRAATSGN